MRQSSCISLDLCSLLLVLNVEPDLRERAVFCTVWTFVSREVKSP